MEDPAARWATSRTAARHVGSPIDSNEYRQPQLVPAHCSSRQRSPQPHDFRLSQLAPTDLRGLPVPEQSEDGTPVSRWYPPEFLPRGGRGVLFMDELNMAAPSMQGVAQQLILEENVKKVWEEVGS